MSNNPARSKALGMLARRSLTSRELRDRLANKGFAAEVIDPVIEELSGQGFINEDDIVEDKIRLGRESRLVGRYLLRFELTKRGIHPDRIETLLDRDYPESDEFQVALLFASRKIKSYEGLTPEKRYRRLSGAITRRGFPGFVIRSVLAELGVSPFGT